MPYRPVWRGPTVLNSRTTVFVAPCVAVRSRGRAHSPNAFDGRVAPARLERRAEHAVGVLVQRAARVLAVDLGRRREQQALAVPRRRAHDVVGAANVLQQRVERVGHDELHADCRREVEDRRPHRATSRSTSSASMVEPSTSSTRSPAQSPSKFARSPVLRSSSTTTRDRPRPSSASTRCEPMKPAPPVTRTVESGRARRASGTLKAWGARVAAAARAAQSVPC